MTLGAAEAFVFAVLMVIWSQRGLEEKANLGKDRACAHGPENKVRSTYHLKQIGPTHAYQPTTHLHHPELPTQLHHPELRISPSRQDTTLEWIEFFAGRAEATRMIQYAGYSVAKLDLNYAHDKADAALRSKKFSTRHTKKCVMDLCSPEGLAWLVCKFMH